MKKEKMNVGLILSGGVGTRAGCDIPKQYVKIGKQCVITYCLETMLYHEMLDVIQIVANEAWHPIIEQEIVCVKEKYGENSMRRYEFSKPGINRQLSILSGLRDIACYADQDSMVMIHDAARPMLSSTMITKYLEVAKHHDGVIPVLPMKDTVYVSSNGSSITGLLKRNQIFAGQAPELFRLGKYLKANEALLPDNILQINGSTEPAVLAGMDVAMVPGCETNFKITTPEDLVHFQKIVEGMA